MPNTYETKLWGGRFRGDEDALMQHFNSECWRTSWLVEPDIQGSLAHVAMQVKCGLLTSAEGEALAQAVIDSVCDAIGQKRRAANPGDYFVIRECAVPAVLVECGFLSNAGDEKRLQDAAHQQALARAICAGILSYMEGKS